MTRATVFVDDWVQGTLPRICSVTGAPTADQIRIRTSVDRPSPLWLVLIIFGPIAWIALLVVHARTNASRLVGVLPMSDGAYLARRHKKRLAWVVLLATYVIFGAIVTRWVGITLIALTLLTGAIAYWVWTRLERPMVSLDASRRWVILDGIHPNLATAIEEQQRTRQPL